MNCSWNILTLIASIAFAGGLPTRGAELVKHTVDAVRDAVDADKIGPLPPKIKSQTGKLRPHTGSVAYTNGANFGGTIIVKVEDNTLNPVHNDMREDLVRDSGIELYVVDGEGAYFGNHGDFKLVLTKIEWNDKARTIKVDFITSRPKRAENVKVADYYYNLKLTFWMTKG